MSTKPRTTGLLQVGLRINSSDSHSSTWNPS
jgi:hypothetical protein